MQRVARRVAVAERTVSRRAKRRADTERRQEFRERLAEDGRLMRTITANEKLSRRILREQWELGPLAPNRGLADARFGLMERQLSRQYDLRAKEVEARCAWAGGAERLCLAEGDRVVVLEGLDAGKVDTIDSIDKKQGEVTLALANRVAFAASPALQKVVKTNSRVANAPVPISAVRLIHPFRDPKTGRFRDVIVRELKPVRWSPDFEGDDAEQALVRWRYGKRHDRVVPGVNTIIPWPKVEEPELETHDCDTLPHDAQARTFVPTLLRPPMPAGVIDELRGKYSRFRTRHEPWYMAQVEARAAEKKLIHKTTLEMRTPLQDFNAQRRAERRARGQPVLGDDMLERIGRIMVMSGASGARKAAKEVGIEQFAAAMKSLTLEARTAAEGGAGGADASAPGTDQTDQTDQTPPPS